MVLVGVDVAEQDGIAVEDVDDDVELAVVEEIADCEASADDYFCKASAFDGGDEFELLSFDLRKRSGRWAQVVPQAMRSTAG